VPSCVFMFHSGNPAGYGMGLYAAYIVAPLILLPLHGSLV
jgi:hypothetical protein